MIRKEVAEEHIIPQIIKITLTKLSIDTLYENFIELKTSDNLISLIELILVYPEWDGELTKLKDELSETNLSAIKYVKEHKTDVFRNIVDNYKTGKLKMIPLALVAIGTILGDKNNIADIVDAYPDDIREEEVLNMYEIDLDDIEDMQYRDLIKSYRELRPKD